MRSFCSDKDEVSLSEHKLDFIDASVLDESLQVMLEILDSIAHTGFVADAMISRKILWDPTVIPRDMNGLVVFPDNRLILLCIL